MPAEASNLLSQSSMSVGHELLVAAVPQLVSVGQRSCYTAAGGLERVFGHQFCVRGRQFAVPINDLCAITVLNVHAAPSTSTSREFTVVVGNDAVGDLNHWGTASSEADDQAHAGRARYRRMHVDVIHTTSWFAGEPRGEIVIDVADARIREVEDLDVHAKVR